MTELGQLLSALRYADSAFPTGGFAFSSGLEGAHRDGFVRDEADVIDFAAEQLRNRWHHHDRVLFHQAFATDDVVCIDATAEALASMSVLREASRRAGAATLVTFAAMLAGHALVADYHHQVRTGVSAGHLPVAQAVCLRAAGLRIDTADTVTAWQLLNGITGAAVRLGVIGHLGAQRAMTALTPLLADVLCSPPPSTPATFIAYADIAAQRRGDGIRLFAS